MKDEELAVDLADDSRFNTFEENIDRVMNTLSVSSEYPDMEYTKETGPGLFIAQKLDEGRDEFIEESEPNAWYQLNNGEDVYIDDKISEVYELIENSVLPDGATLVTPHGAPMDYNVHFYVPDDIKEQVDTTQEKGSKHKSAKAVSKIPNIWWTKVLSAEDGSIITYRDGEQDHPLREREDLIGEVNQSEADWIVEEVIDDPENYDWLEIE
ncbi:MAG: hypothetical protein ABEK10_04590 [Candidatus Nanosalina sp.]